MRGFVTRISAVQSATGVPMSFHRFLPSQDKITDVDNYSLYKFGIVWEQIKVKQTVLCW